jgi:hypothetical protein
VNTKELSHEMWERLTADATTLQLDLRVDEEPEDYFVRLSQGNRRDEVISALRELLALHVVRQPDTKLRVEVQFLTSAFRLCDALEARDCKEPLKLILLEDSADRWGDYLPGLQELAARALLSLPKDKKEFRYWSDVAFMGKSTCPYALNAVLELDLARGLECVRQVYQTVPKGLRKHLANWKEILWMAKESYGEKKFKKVASSFLPKLSQRRGRGLLRILAEVAGIPENAVASYATNLIVAPHHGSKGLVFFDYDVGPDKPNFREESSGNRKGFGYLWSRNLPDVSCISRPRLELGGEADFTKVGRLNNRGTTSETPQIESEDYAAQLFEETR